MAKVSPVSIKYMIHANFTAEGALEKPDVIGAIFGQTEGLLGAELELRELQKEGKIGRIEVDLRKDGKNTVGVIKIPTALDQSETALIGAAIETIERIGPSDSQIEVEKIEDVRGTKRDYIVDRAKKLMMEIQGSTDSREISNTIKDSAKMAEVQEYGDEKLPCGNISEKEIIVVEGRADVLNLMRNNIKNVIAMNGTKLPESIRELSKQKELTLFVDGDRGGKLIIKNVIDNAEVDYIAIAPDGKEVEELTGKEILISLRKKIPAKEFSPKIFRESWEKPKEMEISKAPKEGKINDAEKEKIREILEFNSGSRKAIFLDENLKEMRTMSIKSLITDLRKMRTRPYVIVVDGTVTLPIIKTAEEAGCNTIVAKNFAANSDRVNLLSL
ncbi:MAG: DNA primase [Nanoarchaeota archaeon]|nr:DNA primase [Nanoarchaeota archaeon]